MWKALIDTQQSTKHRERENDHTYFLWYKIWYACWWHLHHRVDRVSGRAWDYDECTETEQCNIVIIPFIMGRNFKANCWQFHHSYQNLARRISCWAATLSLVTFQSILFPVPITVKSELALGASISSCRFQIPASLQSLFQPNQLAVMTPIPSTEGTATTPVLSSHSFSLNQASSIQHLTLLVQTPNNNQRQ